MRFVKTSIVDGNLYFRNVLIRGNDKKIFIFLFLCTTNTFPTI